MNAPPSGKPSVDTRAWLQELKTNRKTQAALIGFALVLGYLLWPEPPRRAARPTGTNLPATAAVGNRQLDSLKKLEDLTRLDRAGELPPEGRVYRDLFLFDMPPPPPPPPPKPLPPPPPPPPPTPEEIEAARLAQARQEATNSRPQALRYLGYMGRASTGRIGSFRKGEEIIALRIGDLANPTWRLTALTETYADFENLKFPDIRYRAEARDTQGPSTSTTTNQF